EAFQALRTAAANRFDARMKIREYEVNILATQLVELSSAIEKMRTTREQEIDDMVNASRPAPKHRHRDQRPKASED
ncbi:MAG: hypothetical protein JKY96_00985, partial [Phycisphaerales bacterium]|nr:hypothetical protein [Phycisphaerales bacterium]